MDQFLAWTLKNTNFLPYKGLVLLETVKLGLAHPTQFFITILYAQMVLLSGFCRAILEIWILFFFFIITIFSK